MLHNTDCGKQVTVTTDLDVTLFWSRRSLSPMIKQVLEGIFFRGNGTTTVRTKIPYETSNYSAASTKIYKSKSSMYFLQSKTCPARSKSIGKYFDY
jgi:hypothetical protein